MVGSICIDSLGVVLNGYGSVPFLKSSISSCFELRKKTNVNKYRDGVRMDCDGMPGKTGHSWSYANFLPLLLSSSWLASPDSISCYDSRVCGA